MYQDNLDKAEFIKGFRTRQKEAGFVSDIGNAVAKPFRMVRDKVNSGVESYLGDRMGNVMKPTLDSAQQAGVSFDRNQHGLPVNFNADKTINNVAGNYATNLGDKVTNFASDLGNKVTGWLGNQWNQASTNPGQWARDNPWTAGGAAALGGGLLYGGSKLIGGMFGGGNNPAPRPQAPPSGGAYGVPQYHGAYGPQAMMKEGAFGLPELGTGFDIPQRIASRLVSPPPPPSFPYPNTQREQQPYTPKFSTEDQRLKKLLEDPKMKQYLVGLLTQR